MRQIAVELNKRGVGTATRGDVAWVNGREFAAENEAAQLGRPRSEAHACDPPLKKL